MTASETAMRVLDAGARRVLERAVLAGRREASAGCRAALVGLGVGEERRPAHLSEEQARLRVGLRAKQRQLGGEFDVLVDECAYEQWHRLLFARFLAERRLLRHPKFGAPVGLGDCEDLASEMDEPDGWAVAGRFAAEILPGIFLLGDPAVQLRLAPESRLALQRIVTELPAELFAADDALGWVYQYWQSERKDEVNTSERKIGGRDLAPVTQLFTEHYMVRFLLENSLGAWWAGRHPDSPLVKGFEYLRFDEHGNLAAGTFDEWPTSVVEVTVMDPCCGSGHFLVEAFGMLWRMRVEEEGLDPVAAQDAVLRDNLFGLELDPRCVQIAMFAVALQAWKDGGGWRLLPMPNIACSGIPAKTPLDEWLALADEDLHLGEALVRLHSLFKEADTLGSLIDPARATENPGSAGQLGLASARYRELQPQLEAISLGETADPAGSVLGADALGLARVAEYLSGVYTMVVTNPPWLGRRHQSSLLLQHADRFHPEARADLATMMIDRIYRLVASSGELGLVTPQNWTTLSAFHDFRTSLLESFAVHIYARLGAGAFREISGEIVKAACISGGAHEATSGHKFAGFDVESARGPEGKAQALRMEPFQSLYQAEVAGSTDRRLVLYSMADASPLSTQAVVYKGLTTGDDPRFRRSFWEREGPLGGDWRTFQSGAASSAVIDGCHSILNLSALQSDPPGGYRPMASDPWGQSGVAVGHVGSIRSALYLGGLYDQSMAAVLPREPSSLPAIWTYLRSEEYETWVRRIDSSIKVTDGSLIKVPFYQEGWQQRAAQEWPDGLPEPSSVDPTQWVFGGRPEVATEPLQVAIARLLSYRWPEQSERDDLDELTDDDGIVCLPSVSGEAEAGSRLEAVLARAFGEMWGPGKRAALLEAAGPKKPSLGAWLREEFFKHHCKVFGNRPFIWQVWDGRKDGFSALVNYHRLDRSRLNKLTYTYLGDWIERQRAQAAADEPGAEARLAAALELQGKLEFILEGEKPYDIYVRWKPLHEQPIGWEPDLDDGVRLNIRPFVEAGVLRSKFSIHWKKDRGKNPDGSERHNDIHLTLAEKRAARAEAGRE